jgi:peptidoglycan/xylan/chitin deacetylase (PgdA/CDA1 family)
VSAAIPILMYHSVAEQPQAAFRFSVSPRVFAAHLAMLREQGFTTLTCCRLAAVLRGEAGLPARPIVLSFDDGYADFHREALPVLIRYGCTATLFVTTGWVADAAEHAAGTPPERMLGWRHLNEVAAAGMEVAAHGHSHAQLDQLAPAALEGELRLSKTLLEDRLGREVAGLAYPYGYHSARVRAAARAAGYRYAAAVSNTAASPRADLFALPRLTIRRATKMAAFQRIINNQAIPWMFVGDRARTAGWAAVRRARRAVSRVRAAMAESEGG